MIEKMYENTQCAVVVNGQLTEWFQVMVGVRQGCLLSPTLFNLFLDFLMKEIRCLQDEISLGATLSTEIRYADDTTLLSAVFNRLQLSTQQLEEGCKKYGLKINGAKCKIITDEVIDFIKLDNNNVEKVQEFTFLGSVVPGTSSDVNRRLALAHVAFGRLKKNIW